MDTSDIRRRLQHGRSTFPGCDVMNLLAEVDRLKLYEQYGWVIEGAWSSTADPAYWCGSSLWMNDHMKALRFARKLDAERAAEMMLADVNVRICEHSWNNS